MRKKVISTVCFLLIIVMLGLSACQNINLSTSDEIQADQSGTLNVLRTDIQLSQEQRTSQIKAEYLKENNGYKDGDIVNVIITLHDDSILDVYNNAQNNITASTVAEYAMSPVGVAQAQILTARQNELLETLSNKNLVQSVEYTYTTVMNGIAASVKYGDLEAIENTNGVSSVILCDTYNLPQTEESDVDVSTISNPVDVYSTGIYNSANEYGYSGKHTAVAVLDSGFDCSHSVFANIPNGELLLDSDTVSSLLQGVTASDGTISYLNATKTTEGLKVTDVYYSDKIPFKYDYADKDPDVNPYDSEHGTHVAGIIGGQDNVITGVAVDTQLVLMKVFADLETGAQTEDILAALEDAVLLGVDAINMSLGSSCGFTREVDEEHINEVYDAVYAAGISLITAASNSYSSGYGGLSSGSFGCVHQRHETAS